MATNDQRDQDVVGRLFKKAEEYATYDAVAKTDDTVFWRMSKDAVHIIRWLTVRNVPLGSDFFTIWNGSNMRIPKQICSSPSETGKTLTSMGIQPLEVHVLYDEITDELLRFLVLAAENPDMEDKPSLFAGNTFWPTNCWSKRASEKSYARGKKTPIKTRS